MVYNKRTSLVHESVCNTKTSKLWRHGQCCNVSVHNLRATPAIHSLVSEEVDSFPIINETIFNDNVRCEDDESSLGVQCETGEVCGTVEVSLTAPGVEGLITISKRIFLFFLFYLFFLFFQNFTST